MKYPDYHVNHLNILCVQNAEILNVVAGRRYSYSWVFEV